MHWLFSHLPVLWLFFIFIGGGAVELLWYYVVVLRAADVRWDAQRCFNKSPRIDLKKARRRQVSMPRLGLPLFLAAIGLYGLQLTWNNWTTYVVISIGWFLTAPLRKMWGIAVARRVSTLQNDGQRPATSYWHDVAFYYSWGFDLPEGPEQKLWFEDKLKWINNFQKLWYILQVWRFWGVFGQAAMALIWPATAVFSAFYHLDNVDEYDYRRPWWRLDPGTKRRDDKVVPGQVIVSKDSPTASRGEPAGGPAPA
jgi:hypothetical protein